jgi:anti-sigma B factor antagonist
MKPVRWEGSAAVVTFPAEVDVLSAGQIRDHLLSVINEGPASLVIDMTPTTFCDSSGINAVVRAYRRAHASGTDVRLVVTAPAVRRIFEVTKIDHLIPVYPGLADALAADPDGPASS